MKGVIKEFSNFLDSQLIDVKFTPADGTMPTIKIRFKEFEEACTYLMPLLNEKLDVLICKYPELKTQLTQLTSAFKERLDEKFFESIPPTLLPPTKNPDPNGSG